MTYVTDTHPLVWLLGDNARLTPAARDAFDDPLNTDFGTALTNFVNGAWASALVLPPDGRIVAAGVFSDAHGNNEFALARYQGR
jgi:Domain of unknown function (DUF5122) beta-propeller